LSPFFSGKPRFITKLSASVSCPLTPGMNGLVVVASIRWMGRVSRPKNVKSFSTLSSPADTASLTINSFNPLRLRPSYLSCMSPNAPTSAMGAQSTFAGSTALAAKYATPDPLTSVAPSMPKTCGLSIVKLGLSCLPVIW